MKKMIKSFAILCFALLIATGAEAYKEVRGGNGIGGTLRDRYSHGESARLDGEVLYKILRAKFSRELDRFPLISDAAWSLFTGAKAKAFYTDTRELHPDCLNSSTAGGKADIWACQNDVEVRITDSFWKNASEDQRADLLLHEMITALFFKTELEGAIEPAFVAFADLNNSTDQIQAEFYRLGFAGLYNAKQTDAVISALGSFSHAACGLETGAARTNLILGYVLNFTSQSKFAEATLFEASAQLLSNELLPWAELHCVAADTTTLKSVLFRAWQAKL